MGGVVAVTAFVGAALPTAVGVMTGERLHAGEIAGIAIGLVAIGLINGVGRGSTRGTRTAVGLAVLAGIGFGLFFILFHAGSGAGVTAFVSGRVGSAVAALGFALVSGVSPLPRRGTWRLLAMGGTLDGAGVVLYLYATFHGLLSLSALLTSFYPAFTVLCARLFIKERMTAMQAAGAVGVDPVQPGIEKPERTVGLVGDGVDRRPLRRRRARACDLDPVRRETRIEALIDIGQADHRRVVRNVRQAACRQSVGDGC